MKFFTDVNKGVNFDTLKLDNLNLAKKFSRNVTQTR